MAISRFLIPPATGLHAKLMLALAILVTLVGIGVAHVLIEREHEIRLMALDGRADRLIELASRSVAYSVWNVDLAAIDEQLASLASDPEVAEFSITAVGYGSLRQINKSHGPLIDPVVRVRAINFTTADTGSQKIGEVRLVLTRALVEQSITAARRSIFALVAAILAALYAATFVLLRRMVSAPINRLETMVDRIALGDLNARCVVESGDELGRLAERVNTMADRLRESDRHLRASQQNLVITLNSIGDAVIATDAAGLITRMNPTAERLTAWPLADALGHPLTDVFRIVSDQTRLPSVDPVQLVMAHGEVVGLANHTALLARDGSEHQIADSASPIRDAAGQVVGIVLVFSDVTEKYRAGEAMRQLQTMLERTESMAHLASYEWDIDTNTVTWSPEMFRIFGRDPAQGIPNLEGQVELYTPASAQILFDAVGKAVSNGTPYEIELMTAQPDGVQRPCIAKGYPERDASGRVVRIAGLVQDITEHKQAEAKLQQAASVFEYAREGIMITDVHGTIVDVNEAFTRITGFSREDAIGQNPRILKSGRQDAGFYENMWRNLTEQGHWSGEVWNRHKNGEVYAELLTISAMRDEQGNTQRYVGLFSDITAIKAHQSQLEHLAHFDALTNLPNRLLLTDRLQQAMTHAQRRGQQLAVAYLDLDGFKNVNDQYGHDIGDQLLIHLATTMKNALREGDTLARIGGDEFVAILLDLDGIESCVPMLKRLLESASAQVQLGAVLLQGSASVGVTVYPQAEGMVADQLLRQADQAMYQAKLAGKNRYHVFDAAQDSSIRVRHESLERIRLALAHGEFVLYYQPKVNMRSGQVIGAEALIRWQHPTKGLLAPAAFLPVIEDHPLAVDVGEWVIEAALSQIELWRNAGLDLPVSVNIGARQLQQDNFVDRLKTFLVQHPAVNPASLELEVLETSALADMVQVSQVIEDCARIGVKFALDDFGTGYSSLTYLRRLRVALLKIDQSFVRDMLDNPDDQAILKGIIGLAAAFKCEVIAEGVETVAHGTLLLQLGCELAQGYGIARPMPPDQMPGWAATWQPDAALSGAMNSGEASRFTDK
jgi:diguanylate cyclase (GGDEF)-like protein/PAS domain S-box-containing protein